MATDPKQHGSHFPDGQARGVATRWLVAGLGFVWLLRSALRPKRHPILSSAPIDVPGHPVAHFKPLRGHEQRDANAPWIFGIVGFLLVAGLCMHFIIAGALLALKRTSAPVDLWRPAHPAAPRVAARAAYPVLQVSPHAELQAFRAREDAELNTYGWVNRPAGIVRVPIGRAMDLVLLQGLPVRAGTNANPGPSPLQLIQQRLDHRESEINRDK